MAISFNEIPSNIRVPNVYVEIDNSRANSGLAQLNTRILIFGQRLSSGTVSAGVPTLVTSKSQGPQYFGQGSMLHNMLDNLFDNNPYTEKWVVALDDNGSGVAASGTLTVTGPATESGTINLYIGGVLVQAAVANADTANSIASAISAAINANLDLPVTSTVSTNVVTVTYRHKGLVGNEVDMRLNYLGDLGGEVTPAGVSIAIVQLTGGTTNPSLTTAIAALEEEIYDFWVMPYNDATSLNSIDTELNDRWGPMRMLEGHMFTAASDTVSNLITLGNSRNNQHVTIFDASNDSPTPCYLWATALVGQVAFSATIDPARPFNTLQLVGIKAPRPENRRTLTEKNTLLYDGIATHNVTKAGIVQLNRVITTYQKNGFDVADASYLDVTTLTTLAYMRQTFRARMTSKFPRHKLADDGTKFGAGQAIVTPKIIKAEIIALAGLWEEVGLLEDMDTFKNELIVERNVTDRNRVDCMLPVNIVNQLQILAAQISFIL